MHPNGRPYVVGKCRNHYNGTIHSGKGGAFLIPLLLPRRIPPTITLHLATISLLLNLSSLLTQKKQESPVNSVSPCICFLSPTILNLHFLDPKIIKVYNGFRSHHMGALTKQKESNECRL